ncbi:MAG: heme ABC transporter ATP-binding protein [Kiloniellales bacterium]|nr:heme ABC transporter ATP-binding protein [Kiloniellales bacterium]
MLEVAGVRIERQGRLLVDGVSFHAGAGELVALIGPNGAGKSSLLKAVTGEWRDAGGRVEIAGRGRRRWAPRALARQVAVMAQSPQVGFDFTVAELVGLGRAPHRGCSTPARDRAIVGEALAAVGLSGFGARSVLELSGGERQRVFLAKAIAQVTPAPGALPGAGSLLLLDEPTSALDLAQQAAAMGAARRIADNGAAVLAVLHDLNLAASFADRVVVMTRGRLAADGVPEEVLTAERLSAWYGCSVCVDQRSGDAVRLISVAAFNLKTRSC